MQRQKVLTSFNFLEIIAKPRKQKTRRLKHVDEKSLNKKERLCQRKQWIERKTMHKDKSNIIQRLQYTCFLVGRSCLCFTVIKKLCRLSTLLDATLCVMKLFSCKKKQERHECEMTFYAWWNSLEWYYSWNWGRLETKGTLVHILPFVTCLSVCDVKKK